MRTGNAKARRADLRRVRQDVLFLIEEQTARTNCADVGTIEEEKPPPAITAIAQQMLDAIGGGTFTIYRKGEGPTIQQRAAEQFEEEQRRLKLRW